MIFIAINAHQNWCNKTEKWKDFLIVFAVRRLFEITKYCLEKFRRSRLQKMPKRKRDIRRTYRSGNEKRKMKAAKESEIKRVSGATRTFIVEEQWAAKIENQIASHSVPWRIKICTIFLYRLCNLLNKLHHRLPWVSSVIQIPRGKPTALMLALSKIVRILRLGPNVFQQLSDIF